MSDTSVLAPKLNATVGQQPVNDALTQALMAARPSNASYAPINQWGAVAPPTFNQNYGQQYDNLSSAMLARYPGQLRNGGAIFDPQGPGGQEVKFPEQQGMPTMPVAPQMTGLTPQQQALKDQIAAQARFNVGGR